MIYFSWQSSRSNEQSHHFAARCDEFHNGKPGTGGRFSLERRVSLRARPSGLRPRRIGSATRRPIRTVGIGLEATGARRCPTSWLGRGSNVIRSSSKRTCLIFIPSSRTKIPLPLNACWTPWKRPSIACRVDHVYFAMQTFFGSVKKRRASSPPSRPTPLCFMPPKGTRRSRTSQQFTQTVPVWICSATR